jgi:hypothetical protein
VHDDALLLAQPGPSMWNGTESSRLSIRHLSGTWRDDEESKEPTVTRGDLLAYLNPLSGLTTEEQGGRVGATRIMHRKDMQMELPLVGSEADPIR